MIIFIRNIQKKVPVDVKWLRHVIKRIGEATNTDDYDICVSLVGNEETQEINKTDRQKDYPADVLSIPLHPNNPPGKRPPEIASEFDLGCLFVSMEKLEEQAKEKNIDLNTHIKKIMIHGYCHLLGYDHETEEDFELMLKEEERLFAIVENIEKE